MGQSSPRFRKDLVASTTEVEGVSFVDVSDAATGTSFRLYDFEYQLALQLDGQPLDEIVTWAGTTYGMNLTPEGILEFAGRLGELGFLEPALPAAEGDLAPSTVAAPVPMPMTDSAEVEWLSLQGAKTSTFVPDELMLHQAAKDVTPVPHPSPSRLVRRPTPSNVMELLDSAVGQEPGSAQARSPSVPGLPVVPKSDRGPTPNGAGPAAPASAGPPSRGTAPRRIPSPADGSVVVSPGEEGSRGRFTAPPPRRAQRRSPLVVVVGLLVAGGAGAGYYRWTQLHPSAPPALKVRVLSPKPTAVYRWFSTPGSVTDAGAGPLTFEGGGHVAELLAVGKKFAAGDIIGKLAGAGPVEAELGRLRPKLAAAQQVRDSVKGSGNAAELRQAESKLADRKKSYDEAQASLNKMVIRAPEAGEVTEVLVKLGASVPPKTAAIKWKGKLLHGDFTLDEEDSAQASKLDFCRVEVVQPAQAGAAAGTPPAEARFLDCKLPPPAPAPTARSGSLLRKFLVSLPSGAGLAPGQALRLARLRYDAVFALPLTAVLHGEGGDKVWVASPLGAAHLRPVTIAEARDEALVSGGLALGEDVILDPSPDLQDGTRVTPER